MKLNKREEFLCWKSLEYPITRYLLSLKRSGYERAERHIEISTFIWEVKNLKTYSPGFIKEGSLKSNWDEVMEIHDLIAEKVTNHLDKTIGLDLDLDEWNYDILADRMFRKILKVI